MAGLNSEEIFYQALTTNHSFSEVIENTLRNQIKVESGTSSRAAGGWCRARMGGRHRPRGAPAECFGIKYRFNYLRERFIALRKCAEKKLRATCASKVFFLENL